jgi:tryptophan synthase alpha chain
MDRIRTAFEKAKRQSRPAIMPFVCGGFPAPGVTARAITALSAAGAPVIEVGIPFSDPIADGPVIAAAMHDVLSPTDGTPAASPERVMAEIAGIRATTDAALVAMVSCSIVFRVGMKRFVEQSAAAGFDGFIVPDLPLEESDELRSLAAGAGLAVSLLIAPTTPTDRARRIAQACTGFVYLMARTGITGDGGSGGGSGMSAPDLASRVRELRDVTDLPIACGFGISKPQHVREVLKHADAAIVGSALVKRMDDAHKQKTDPVAAVLALYKDLAQIMA